MTTLGFSATCPTCGNDLNHVGSPHVDDPRTAIAYVECEECDRLYTCVVTLRPTTRRVTV